MDKLTYRTLAKSPSWVPQCNCDEWLDGTFYSCGALYIRSAIANGTARPWTPFRFCPWCGKKLAKKELKYVNQETTSS